MIAITVTFRPTVDTLTIGDTKSKKAHKIIVRFLLPQIIPKTMERSVIFGDALLEKPSVHLPNVPIPNGSSSCPRNLYRWHNAHYNCKWRIVFDRSSI